MKTKEAAEFLGYAEKTLRASRVSGTLAGVTSPPYIKRGQFCIYDKADLEEWLAQFKKITHTGQSSI
ncbi:MAG: helix-turn-helix domain-containing protein [Cellvibrionaceae bacterium]